MSLVAPAKLPKKKLFGSFRAAEYVRAGASRPFLQDADGRGPPSRLFFAPRLARICFLCLLCSKKAAAQALAIAIFTTDEKETTDEY